jgi:two-component system chemotaxis sensor kinase CheA
MNVLHEQFILEARELIHQVIDDLIAIEREGHAAERVDRIFRAFHTLKGAAGVVDLPAMGLTLHAAEDLLAAIKAEKLRVTPAVIDGALACLDLVSHWVDGFETHEILPTRAGEDSRAMAARLRRLLSDDGAKPPSVPQRQPSPGTNRQAMPDWVVRLIGTHRDKIAGHNTTALVAISYEPATECFFDGDDPLRLMRQIPNLVIFHSESRAAWPTLADLNPFACNLRLQAIAACDRDELSNLFRLVPDQIDIVDIPPVSRVSGDNDDATALIRNVLEEQIRVLRAAGRAEDFIGRVGAVARVAANALHHGANSALTEEIGRARAAAVDQQDMTPLLHALDQTIVALTLPAPAGEDSDPVEGVVSEDTARGTSRSLRVSESRIDALFNLAGELIVLKNSFAHLAKHLENEAGGRESGRAIRQQHDALDRLSGEMHSAILQLRMVPVAQVFGSFPRLVRDIAQRLDKKVELVTEGETTESDKTIVDRLFEPLLHLVRNALDHGIESSEQRRAAGKDVHATITLRAARLGDRFVVEVVDDGRGIDPVLIRDRARARGLMASADLEALSDEHVMDLVFAVGFSTATEISDISGRGVGMDAVRGAIEQIGGRVSLTSRVGNGTTVRLDLPMNIAMSRIMVVEAGGQVFGIPMDAVTETVRLPPDRIHQIKNNDGFVLRDRVVPICSLSVLMHLPERQERRTDVRLFVVTELNGKVAAIEVDAIRDRLEVVLKPMQGLLSSARAYSGTTLLGDGGVLLVLDLKEILP